MKSLAESILSSTNTGKNKKIDVEYLLTHGFEPDARYGSPKTMFKHKETGYSLRTFRNKILLDIFDDVSIFTKTLVVSTIGDLELVIKWFKEYHNSKTEEEKLRKEIFKKLKEFEIYS